MCPHHFSLSPSRIDPATAWQDWGGSKLNGKAGSAGHSWNGAIQQNWKRNRPWCCSWNGRWCPWWQVWQYSPSLREQRRQCAVAADRGRGGDGPVLSGHAYTPGDASDKRVRTPVSRPAAGSDFGGNQTGGDSALNPLHRLRGDDSDRMIVPSMAQDPYRPARSCGLFFSGARLHRGSAYPSRPVTG